MARIINWFFMIFSYGKTIHWSGKKVKEKKTFQILLSTHSSSDLAQKKKFSDPSPPLISSRPIKFLLRISPWIDFPERKSQRKIWMGEDNFNAAKCAGKQLRGLYCRYLPTRFRFLTRPKAFQDWLFFYNWEWLKKQRLKTGKTSNDNLELFCQFIKWWNSSYLFRGCRGGEGPASIRMEMSSSFSFLLLLLPLHRRQQKCKILTTMVRERRGRRRRRTN